MVYDTIFYFCDIIKELVWKLHFYQVTKIMPSSMKIIFNAYFIFAAKFCVLGSNKWQGKHVEWIWSYKKCLSWMVSYFSSAPVLKRIKRYNHAVSVTNSDRTLRYTKLRTSKYISGSKLLLFRRTSNNVRNSRHLSVCTE